MEREKRRSGSRLPAKVNLQRQRGLGRRERAEKMGNWEKRGDGRVEKRSTHLQCECGARTTIEKRSATLQSRNEQWQTHFGESAEEFDGYRHNEVSAEYTKDIKECEYHERSTLRDRRGSAQRGRGERERGTHWWNEARTDLTSDGDGGGKHREHRQHGNERRQASQRHQNRSTRSRRDETFRAARADRAGTSREGAKSRR